MWPVVFLLLTLEHFLPLTPVSAANVPEQSSIPGKWQNTPELVHVSQCNFCLKCDLQGSGPSPGGSPGGGGTLSPDSFQASKQSCLRKQKLPNCKQCTGCTTELLPASNCSQQLHFNRSFAREGGNSHGHAYCASTNRTASGTAMVKIFCLPISKASHFRPVCAPKEVCNVSKRLLAVHKVAEDCGFDDIVPKVWVEKLDAIIPGVGFHAYWHAIWMELARGVSLEAFLYRGQPRMLRQPMVDHLTHRLNSTQVLRAAIFDLLTSQSDRHAQNIFVNEDGNIKLIDNDRAFSSLWGFDSIFIPGTQKFEIPRLTNEFVQKLLPASKIDKGWADAQVLLDYRCHKPVIGTDYPPKVKQCMQRIAALDEASVMQIYGMLDISQARNLRTRATDMLTKGFEWTYKYGAPRNPNPKRYRPSPPCCQVRWPVTSRFGKCNHTWDVKYELPYGDPNTGQAWAITARPDTGSYEGGTFLD